MKVLVDTMNLVFISFNVAKTKVIKEKGEFLKEDLGFFYHLFFNKVNELFREYGNVVFCTEGRGSLEWRRSIYPHYKRNRDKSKKEESYLILKNEFSKIEDILKLYPSKVISVEGAEADDTIYALSTHFADLGEDVLVVSSDGDLTQLTLFNDKIRVYNPVKREISSPNPNIIKYKAIVGDRADGIAGLHRLGEKTFEKMMLDESVFIEKISGKEEELESLLKIVDLRKYPPEFHRKAIDEFNALEWNEFDPSAVEEFMVEKGLTQNLSFWWSNVAEIYDAVNGETSRESSENINIGLDELMNFIREGVF